MREKRYDDSFRKAHLSGWGPLGWKNTQPGGLSLQAPHMLSESMGHGPQVTSVLFVQLVGSTDPAVGGHRASLPP